MNRRATIKMLKKIVNLSKTGDTSSVKAEINQIKAINATGMKMMPGRHLELVKTIRE